MRAWNISFLGLIFFAFLGRLGKLSPETFGQIESLTTSSIDDFWVCPDKQKNMRL